MNSRIMISTIFVASLISLFSLTLYSTEPIAARWKEKAAHKWISPPIKEWSKSDTTCDLYQGYWVLTVEYVGKVGGDYGSTSIDKDIFFLDSGTENWRGLQIINLENKKQIVSMGYHGLVAKFSLVSDELIYTGPLDSSEKEPSWILFRKCVWSPQHKPKGWFQESYEGTQRINLKTGKKTTTGVTCKVELAAG